MRNQPIHQRQMVTHHDIAEQPSEPDHVRNHSSSPANGMLRQRGSTSAVDSAAFIGLWDQSVGRLSTASSPTTPPVCGRTNTRASPSSVGAAESAKIWRVGTTSCALNGEATGLESLRARSCWLATRSAVVCWAGSRLRRPSRTFDVRLCRALSRDASVRFVVRASRSTPFSPSRRG